MSKASAAAGAQHGHHHEDLLGRTWRAIAHSLVSVTSKAEKVAADSNNRDLQNELNDATKTFLYNRIEWGKTISYLEAELEGKAAETESLQHFVRTHPSMGKSRKRKREADAASSKIAPPPSAQQPEADQPPPI